MLGVAFGAGFVLGPALGGLAGNISPRLPFWIAAGLSLANALLRLAGAAGIAAAAKRARRSRGGGPIRSASLDAAALASAAVRASRPSSFLGNLAHASLPSISVLYMMYRYGWDERTVGFTMAGVGLCAMVVQGGLIGPHVKRFGERGTLLIGLVFGVAGFAVFGLAPNGSVFWAGIPLMALWGFASPSALGLMSRLVGPTEQGQLQGANASLMGDRQPGRAGPVHPVPSRSSSGPAAPGTCRARRFCWRRCCWRSRSSSPGAAVTAQAS